jgi:Glycosyl hydrolases family 16
MTYQSDASALGAKADAEIAALNQEIVKLKAQLSAATSPSGKPYPTTDPAGWTRVYGRDDWTGVNLETDLVPYPDLWKDTSKAGTYSGATQTKASPSLLTVTLATVNGIPRTTALQPRGWVGRRGGRFSICAKMTANKPGYKVAWLLWPTSDKWPSQGEIDFPECGIPGKPTMYMHHAYAAATPSTQTVISTPVGTTTADWHVYTIDWTPPTTYGGSNGLVIAYMDGVEIGRTTKYIPFDPMRWVIQCETDNGVPAADAVAKIEIDWIAEWQKI